MSWPYGIAGQEKYRGKTILFSLKDLSALYGIQYSSGQCQQCLLGSKFFYYCVIHCHAVNRRSTIHGERQVSQQLV